MITGLLLLPVAAILVWLYWYLLPGRQWKWQDFAWLAIAAGAAAAFVRYSRHLDLGEGGPLWPLLVEATGAYLLFTTLLALGLWRRRSKQPG